MATTTTSMISSTTPRKNNNTTMMMYSSSRSAMSFACSTSKSQAFQKKKNYAPKNTSPLGVPLRRRRTIRTSAVARGPGGEFFEEEEKKYENNQEMSSASGSTNNGPSSSSSSKSSSSSSNNTNGAKNELDPEMDLPRRNNNKDHAAASSSSFAREQQSTKKESSSCDSKKKKVPPAATKKKSNDTTTTNNKNNNNNNNNATRTMTTKENATISYSSVPKRSAKKSSGAITATTMAIANNNNNTNTNNTKTKEEGEETCSSKKEEEDVEEDEDQAPKHETTILSKEQFEMQKKRLELLIEEKEWAVEEARDNEARSSVKLQRVLDYVNAVEAYKELCSSRVPDTVSDFLGNYVNVLCLPKHAKGYDEALSFLGIDFEDLDEDDLEITHEDFLRETEHYMRIEERYDSERKESGGSFEDEGEYYEDDEEEYYEDDEDLLEALLGGDANYIAEMKLPLELHLAQDIDGNWRWLEDDLGRVLKRKPEGDFIFRLMSFEDLMNEGLNVNCLREEVDPNELIDFSKCRSFDDARRAMKEATEALRNMEADGWVVEKSFSATAASFGASSSGDSTNSVFDIREESSGRHLCMTKELRPLRTMSHVDGLHPEEDEKCEREIHREEAAGAMARDAFDSFDDNE
ncbi:unnamed protein product [Bathycoccus prasinos]